MLLISLNILYVFRIFVIQALLWKYECTHTHTHTQEWPVLLFKSYFFSTIQWSNVCVCLCLDGWLVGWLFVRSNFIFKFTFFFHLVIYKFFFCIFSSFFTSLVVVVVVVDVVDVFVFVLVLGVMMFVCVWVCIFYILMCENVTLTIYLYCNCGFFKYFFLSSFSNDHKWLIYDKYDDNFKERTKKKETQMMMMAMAMIR